MSEAIKMYKIKLEEYRFEAFGDDLDLLDEREVSNRERNAVLMKIRSLGLGRQVISLFWLELL